MPEETHWTTTSQIIVMTPKVVAETPAYGQGETVDRLNPAPKAISTSPIAAITKAPPKIAPHDVPDNELTAA